MPGLPNFQLYQRSYRSMILEVYDRSQCSVVFKSFLVKCIGCRFQKQAREWAWESWRETIYHQDQLEDKELHLLGIAIAPSIYMEKKMYNMLLQLLYSEVKKNWEKQEGSRGLLFFICYEALNWEARSMKVSSLQGIVRPPIEWLNPNSSSACCNKSWNEGWFK